MKVWWPRLLTKFVSIDIFSYFFSTKGNDAQFVLDLFVSLYQLRLVQSFFPNISPVHRGTCLVTLTHKS